MVTVKLSPEATREVLSLKERYEHLFYFKKGAVEVIFRPLSLQEYKSVTAIATIGTEVEVEDYIINLAVLYITGGITEFLTASPAGLPAALAALILDYSGFGNLDKINQTIETARKETDTLESVIHIFIQAALGIGPDKLKQYDIYTQCSLLALAEKILGKTIDDLDPKKKLLSRRYADRVDINKDNKILMQEFLTASERMGLDNGRS